MAKIMLVEDDNNLREIYEARLLAEGYEIVAAKDGEEALALAVKEKPDLIISDVMMPKISGFDMLDILRSTPETKNTKVIMMTALSQAEDKARADKLGADRYLVKSQVTLEDVAKVARDVLAGEGSATPAPAAEAPAATPTAPAAPAVPAPVPPVTEPVASTPTPPAIPPADPIPAPAPAAEPVAAPAPDPAPVSTPPVDPAPATDTATPAPAATPTSSAPIAEDLGQTTASEEAAINAQIDAFVSKVAPEPTEPTTPTPVEQPTPTDAAPAAAAVTPTPADATPAVVPAPPSEAPTPAPAAPLVAPTPVADGPVTINNKKIITPINSVAQPKPDLNALLAKEEAKEGNGPQTPPPPPAPTGSDPNNIAL
jgi:CheY-like chemotaxis protein